jgi:hypothetical protein
MGRVWLVACGPVLALTPRPFSSSGQGVDPGQEFIEVERAVLRQDPPLVAIDVTARAAGPNTLPAAPASFVGRTDELAEQRWTISNTSWTPGPSSQACCAPHPR